MQDFANYWQKLEADLEEPVVLSRQRTLAAFEASIQELKDCVAGLTDNKIALKIARGEVNLHKPALLERMRQFSRLVRALLKDQSALSVLPAVPVPTLGPHRVLPLLRDMLQLWEQLEAEPPPGLPTPLLLLKGYTRQQFAADLQTLKANYAAINDIKQDRKLLTSERAQLERAAKATMRDLRLMVKGLLPPDAPLVTSLPLLYTVYPRKPKPEPEA